MLFHSKRKLVISSFVLPMLLKKFTSMNILLFLPSDKPFSISFMQGGSLSIFRGRETGTKDFVSATSVVFLSSDSKASYALIKSEDASFLVGERSKKSKLVSTFSGIACSRLNSSTLFLFIGTEANHFFSLREYYILNMCLSEIRTVSMSIIE